jgi:hypothetical protein
MKKPSSTASNYKSSRRMFLSSGCFFGKTFGLRESVSDGITRGIKIRT